MARTKAYYMKELYRDPSFKEGLCSCCGIRPRNWQHPTSPHMCDKCRETRVGGSQSGVSARAAVENKQYALSPEEQVRNAALAFVNKAKPTPSDTATQLSKEQELINRARAENWSSERFQSEYEKLKREESDNEQPQS